MPRPYLVLHNRVETVRGEIYIRIEKSLSKVANLLELNGFRC